MSERIIPEKDRPSYERGGLGDFELGPDSFPLPGVQAGTRWGGRLIDSSVYPGNSHDYEVHLPAGHDAAIPAPLLVALDGHRADEWFRLTTVIDNLVHRGDLPSLITVLSSPGPVGPGAPIYGGDDNRSIEYDSVGPAFSRFLLDELLPEVESRVALSVDPDQRAIFGISSGAAAAFTAAWERPDRFRRVLSAAGSFTDIRGADRYAKAVRREEAKPLRVFLQAGTRDLDILFGSWYLANLELAAALEYAGYDYRLEVGDGGHGHQHMAAILPEALRWLWRD